MMDQFNLVKLDCQHLMQQKIGFGVLESASGLFYVAVLWYNPIKVSVYSNNKKNMATKTNSAFMKPMTVSSELAVIVGKGPMPRSEVVKNLWVYIKKNNLQDPKNKRNINADASLQAVFGGKKVVNMFEMTKLVSAHLS
jgi:chromatin remodeling complex protein RSC6